MKSEIYDIVLRSPIGPKKGSLTILVDGDSYSAEIYLMRHWNRFSAKPLSSGEYSLSGSLWTLVGDVGCKIHARVVNGILSAVADTSKGIMAIEGNLIHEGSATCE